MMMPPVYGIAHASPSSTTALGPAAFAAARGQTVFSPKVILPEGLVTAQVSQAGAVSRLESLLAWTKVLLEIEVTEFRNVFPLDPPSRSFAWAVRLARKLVELKTGLGEAGLRLADVAPRAGDGFGEVVHWQQIAGWSVNTRRNWRRRDGPTPRIWHWLRWSRRPRRPCPQRGCSPDSTSSGVFICLLRSPLPGLESAHPRTGEAVGRLAGLEAALAQDGFPGNVAGDLGSIYGRRSLDLARPEDARLAEMAEAWRELLRQAALLHAEDEAGRSARTPEVWLRRLDSLLAPDDVFGRERGAQFVAAARRFDATGSRDVDEFIRFMEGHKERETESAAVVRVMTIKKGKGLGFDLVILPDLEGSGLDQRRDGLAVEKAPGRCGRSCSQRGSWWSISSRIVSASPTGWRRRPSATRDRSVFIDGLRQC
jgi:hypothetical protein